MNITDQGAISAYMRYLIRFADELKAGDDIVQEDVDRLNLEISEFCKQLEAVPARRDLVNALKALLIPKVDAPCKRMSFYALSFAVLGWLGLFAGTAWREHHKTQACRELLTAFREKMLSLLEMEEAGVPNQNCRPMLHAADS